VRTDIEITRGKPGCLWYSLAEDVVEDNVFRLSEGWATREDLEAHFVSEPFQRTVAAVSTLKRAIESPTSTTSAAPSSPTSQQPPNRSLSQLSLVSERT